MTGRHFVNRSIFHQIISSTEPVPGIYHIIEHSTSYFTLRTAHMRVQFFDALSLIWWHSIWTFSLVSVCDKMRAT